ncbi:SDR family NAD(P)-dependent oxidoreductase [Arthrobacter mobilis]|uniref:SDR family oxidoreductase n=1 Tax=Arthrobacter mobilis TaxID=2724944 RepID=A0A7X6HEA2_9MICC|nr:SDR family oxidoreductase [Arthrobacter mobilis]NKX55543.1 SDR family oxidoreductase [Arthrobacter mobilis]
MNSQTVSLSAQQQEAAAGEFTGRTVLITGGAGGIGLAIAEAFAAQGAVPVLIDVAAAVAEAGAGLNGHGLQLDLGEPSAAEDAVRFAVERTGRLDVLINAAGIQLRTEAAEVEEPDWQRLVDVNLSAAYRLCRAAVPALTESKGCIVNIASLSADRAVPGIVPYGATKAALVQLGKGLAAELGSKGIRVNAVSPGYIVTPMTAEVLDQQDFRDRVLTRIPLQRLADGHDVADAVVFLASHAARYITGVVLPVDGGYSIT